MNITLTSTMPRERRAVISESERCDSKRKLNIFRRPYCDWTPDAILTHYKSRTGIRYFPVLDREQTTRSVIDNILFNRFELTGESHQLPPDFDWTVNPSQDLEWLIMLHKFYYAVGLGAAYHETGDQRYVEKWIELTSSWIDTVPIGFPSGDAVGRRIQNWIFAHYYFVTLDETSRLPADFYLSFLDSIYHQVNHLRGHLTPARNHRTIELYAIFLAAVVFPELQGADAWLAFAREELVKNIHTDLLADGVHCELSTDYHHVVLKNILGVRRLALLNDIAIPEETDVLIRKGLEFAAYVHKPDGLIPSLSDGDTGSALDLLADGYDLYQDEALLYVASRGRRGTPPACRSKGFPDGGYHILRSGWGNGSEPFEDERYLVFDCGPLGRGNHGHLDLLSFEMAAYGQSLVVDPGRYVYDESGGTNWRVLFRGTGYHNTVQVDKKNQTRYALGKNSFKIQGPEPDRELKEQITGANYDYLRGVARSDEYDAVHERRIFFFAPEYWIVSDIIRAEETHDYDLLFHLSGLASGNVSVTRSEKALVVDSPHLVMAQPTDPEVRVFVEDGFVSHTYGVKHPAPVLRFARRAADASFHTVLYPFKATRPQITVEAMPVWHGARQCLPSEALALSVAVTRDGQRFQDYYFSADPKQRRDYRFGPFTYNGSLLFIRDTPAGRTVDIRTEPTAELTIRGAGALVGSGSPW